MKMTMPMAVFGGLALIAAAIYFGSGSQPVNAGGGVQKVAICDYGNIYKCAVVNHRRLWVNPVDIKIPDSIAVPDDDI